MKQKGIFKFKISGVIPFNIIAVSQVDGCLPIVSNQSPVPFVS
jgi:hypothetical protein